MLVIRGLLLVCFALVIAGCKSPPPEEPGKPKDLILGKWSSTKKQKRGDKEFEVTVSMEFLGDGKLKMDLSAGGESKGAEGKYQFLDENTIEMDVPAFKKSKKKAGIQSVTRDKLVLVDSDGAEKETIELKRVR